MKATVLMVSLAGALVLAACGGGSSSSATPTAPAATTAGAPTTVGASPTTAAAAPTAAGTAALSDGNAPGIPPVHGTIQTTASGLRYIDETVGSGASPQPTDTVTVNYTGWLTDGTKFDSSVD
ncbi:MAG TPA: FKBP-type peptidyl-prolyl cis-trans isomerase, partial [Dehalococcoidia bacterium]|nr:FKBP-type peptidyl-prolyl cis-trans isomerase [Dehalococcoidia bacterium]